MNVKFLLKIVKIGLEPGLEPWTTGSISSGLARAAEPYPVTINQYLCMMILSRPAVTFYVTAYLNNSIFINIHKYNPYPLICRYIYIFSISSDANAHSSTSNVTYFSFFFNSVSSSFGTPIHSN